MPKGFAVGPTKTETYLDEMNRLDSWKEIANFFKREVRTVQLWERHESLPVHRHQHRKLGTVYAYKPELIRWWKVRCRRSPDGQKATTQKASPEGQQTSLPQTALITLAVLPLVYTPEKSSLQHMSFAFTQQLIGQLDRFASRGLRVSRTMAVAQRHAGGVKLHEIKVQTDADFILETSIDNSNHSTHIRLKLTRVRGAVQMWSGEFVYLSEELEQLCAHLAEKLSRALFHEVMISRHIVKSNTVHPAARYAYLRGRYLWSRRTTAESIFSAMQQFKLATELDPRHAAAYSGLSDCYAVLGWIGSLSRETAMLESRKAALTALSLDDALAEGHVSLGCVLFDFDWNWEGAERELLRGIELNPAYAQAYCWYGQILTALGRRQEAMDVARIAQDIDPASAIVNLSLGTALYYAGEYEDAIQQFQHVLEIQPSYAMGHSGLGLAYSQVGEATLAVEHLQFALNRCGGDANVQAMLAYVYAVGGQTSEAYDLLGRLELSGNAQKVPAFDSAAAFTAVGDKDTAMEFLWKGYDQRNIRLTKLKCDPRLLPLHGDPRFQSLSRQMGLA
jgi:tetratricopeptide (TPR) repeat protein